MSNAAPSGKPPPPREFSPLPALLSFLVPGLGQIYQGRVAKGVLFLIAIYALFFYGMYLGSGTVQAGEPLKTYTVTGNVYLPQAPKQTPRWPTCRSSSTTCTIVRSTSASSGSASSPGRPCGSITPTTRTRTPIRSWASSSARRPTRRSTPSTPMATNASSLAGCTPSSLAC